MCYACKKTAEARFNDVLQGQKIAERYTVVIK